MEEHRNIYEIRIKKGQEHRAAISPENVNSPTEFFFNAYQDAKYQLCEIVLASSRIKKSETREFSTKKRIEQLHEYPNNVIAFCADRGRGKTTAMLSFSGALEALGDPQEGFSRAFWGNVSGDEKPLKVRFEVMAPIDPASMENSESVLQQIISQLFENFCKELKNRHRFREYGVKDYDPDIIADKFRKCAQAIDSLYKDPQNRNRLIEDELDQIAEIGQSGKLLLLLHELIDSYLNFICGKDTECCLVVQIDDADMDIGRAYQILEDVRKYLGLPQVIVLMATNIQQLETTVEQHFLQEYKQGLRYSESMITVERCHDIAELYLEKAIPHTRRIYLPEISEIIRRNLSHITVNYQDGSGHNIISGSGTYQKQLLDLLHRKTGMVFTFETDYLHNLLPAHMRELSQFLPFFASMEDLFSGLKKGMNDGYEIAIQTFQYQGFADESDTLAFLDRWEKNLRRLEFYLVNLWSGINLREGSRNLFREFVAQPEKIRNLYLLRNIADYYVRERIASENTRSTFVGDELDCRNEFIRACELRGIDLTSYLEETVQGEISASYADIMGVLATLTDLPGANRQYKFAYAIRLFYSIRLHITLIQEIRAIGGGIQTIDFCTLTYLLRDTLLKNGPINDTAQTPFGCWLLEMPVQWFQPDFLPLKDDEPIRSEIPFLRWKYTKDHTIHMASTVASGGVDGVWRTVGTPMGQKEMNTVVFNPLYPLLAALDRFIRFQNIRMIENDIVVHKSQIYIALVVCLNWDVQRILFKKIKNQTSYVVKDMAAELYDRFIAEDLLDLLPNGVPLWLDRKCFTNTCEQAYETIFDILIQRIHPVPEFNVYILNAREGLGQFDNCLSELHRAIENASKERMVDLWEKKDDNIIAVLKKMDEAVEKAIFSSKAVSIRIKEEITKNSHLYTLLTEFLDCEPHSLKESSLTPESVKRALERYIVQLERLLQHGADDVDGKFAKKRLKEKTEATLSEVSVSTAQVEAEKREATAHTLQELIQFGQQLLNVLNTPIHKNLDVPEE